MPTAAHNRWWQIGEVVLGGPLLLAVALQLVAPLRLPEGGYGFLLDVAGGALLIAGVVVVVLARRELARHGQPTDPGRPTRRLVTSGVFSISRNPLYLGAVAFLAGLSLMIGLGWMLVLLIPAMLACHYVLIAPEERYLTGVFGAEFEAYTARVGRWLGRRSR
jgi:protein-S-isoprenylcysteine O-methyltransferase Ste14